LLRWALKECVIGAEIYENCAFQRFRRLSVENVEEKISEKVIHSLFFFACFTRPETRQSGGTQGFRLS